MTPKSPHFPPAPCRLERRGAGRRGHFPVRRRWLRTDQPQRDGSGEGVGTALPATVEAAPGAGAGQVWLITTDDNLDAPRFSQRRGYHPPALYPGSVDAARRAKPTVRTTDSHDTPLRDELELAKRAYGVARFGRQGASRLSFVILGRGEGAVPLAPGESGYHAGVAGADPALRLRMTPTSELPLFAQTADGARHRPISRLARPPARRGAGRSTRSARGAR